MRFGGFVNARDYEDKISLSQMAKRIAQDFLFDQRCRENLEKRLTSDN